jgi:hypothetical protein
MYASFLALPIFGSLPIFICFQRFDRTSGFRTVFTSLSWGRFFSSHPRASAPIRGRMQEIPGEAF